MVIPSDNGYTSFKIPDTPFRVNFANTDSITVFFASKTIEIWRKDDRL